MVRLVPPGIPSFAPVGVVRSAYVDRAGMPLQSVADDSEGQIELFGEYAAGLRDVEGFSHLHVLSYLHAAGPASLLVVPYLDDVERGVFATRAPRRPNAIGLSVVRVIGVRPPVIEVRGLDLLDGTPVLDLKPYVPAFDHWAADRIGWFAGRAERVHERRADDRP